MKLKKISFFMTRRGKIAPSALPAILSAVVLTKAEAPATAEIPDHWRLPGERDRPGRTRRRLAGGFLFFTIHHSLFKIQPSQIPFGCLWERFAYDSGPHPGAGQNSSFPWVGTARCAVRASQRDAPTIEEFCPTPPAPISWKAGLLSGAEGSSIAQPPPTLGPGANRLRPMSDGGGLNYERF